MREADKGWRDRQLQLGRSRLLWGYLAVVFWGGVAVSGEEIEQPIEELFQTELVYPQEQGELQLTLSPRWQRGSEEDRFQSRVSLEYGITDTLQIGLEWDVFSTLEPEAGGRVEGVGDLEIGFKVARMDPTGKLHMAFGVEVGLPLADVDDELGEGFLEIEPFVAIARDVPGFHDLQVFGQIGIGLVSRVERPADPEEEEPAAHELEISLGLFVPIASVVATLELNWSTNTWNHGGEENELYLTPGLVRSFADRWEAGLGVPVGLNDDADDYRLIAMLSAEF